MWCTPRLYLGPTPVLLYINDLYHVCNNSILILFADDTNLFFSGSDPKELESEINTELDHISTWLKVNKLSLNVQKTHFMVFSRKKKYINAMLHYVLKIK